MRKHVYVVSAALVAAGALAAPVAASRPDAPAQPKNVRVSIDSGERQGNNISGRSARPEVNATGSVVVFDSIATNLVHNDGNHANDVFVRDRMSGRTSRVSVSSSGQESNGDSSRPDVSGDGRFVVFDSSASNLVTGDTNNASDVFVHDRVTQTTALVSQTRSGRSGNGASFSPTISEDGRYVGFTTNASNLTRRPAAGAVLLRDLQTGRTKVVSLRQDGTAAPAASPSLSANGRYVAFASFASDIVAGDTNDAFDVFVRDRRLGTTTRVSVDSSGAEAQGGGSFQPAITADGHMVAFASEATNLVASDTNAVRDIFVRDIPAGTTVRASVASDGTEANGQSDGPGIRGGSTFGPDISGDGRLVTFDSIASNLVADDTNTCSYSGGPSFPEPGQCPDVFVRDLQAGTTTRVSVSSSGDQANDASTDPAISTDGMKVVFFSTASFVADDTNTCPPFFFGHPGACPDIYLHTN
jgi:Tol biopolymer transport system component